MKRTLLLCVLVILAVLALAAVYLSFLISPAAAPASPKTVAVLFKVTIRGCDLPVGIANPEGGETVLYTRGELLVSHPQPEATHAFIGEFWREMGTRLIDDKQTRTYQRQAWLKIDTTSKCSLTTQPWTATLIEE